MRATHGGVRLLTALVARHRSLLRVAELEGDAVFLWGPLDDHDRGVGVDLNQQLLGFFGAFRSEVAALRALPLCVCGACTSVADLRLKQVVHVGEVATGSRTASRTRRFAPTSSSSTACSRTPWAATSTSL